jgi:NADH dehydrogenase/NADH:ubiquinone oxidoreductase subunit G
MPEHTLKVDGREIRAEAGTSLLAALQGAGIAVPTLCHHEALAAYGGCRLCIVEAEGRAGPRLVVSCVHPVEEDLVVRTRSEKIDRIRKGLLELLLAHAPHAPELQRMAADYGADAERFERDASFCVHCGLCVRYCAEVKKSHAVGFIDRGMHKEIRFVPEIAARECDRCKECFPLCPTSYLQAAYVLTECLAFPARS